MKKFYVSLMTAVVLCMMSVCVFATSNEVPVLVATKEANEVHWSSVYTEKLAGWNVVEEYDAVNYGADVPSTRREVIVKIDKLFNLTEKGSLKGFTDITKSDADYDAVSRVVGAGIIEGVSKTKLGLDEKVTRAQIVTMYNRVWRLDFTDESVLNKFVDSGDLESWSRKHVGAFIEHEYMNGYPDLTLRLNDDVTRGEADKLLAEAVGLRADKAGTYDVKDVKGNVVVLAKDVKLVNASDIDGIFALNSAVKRTTFVDGKKNLASVAVLVESKTSGGGGGNGGSITKPTVSPSGEITITAPADDGSDYPVYDIDTENIKNAEEVTVYVDESTPIVLKDDANLTENLVTVIEAMATDEDTTYVAVNTLGENADINNTIFRNLAKSTAQKVEAKGYEGAYYLVFEYWMLNKDSETVVSDAYLELTYPDNFDGGNAPTAMVVRDAAIEVLREMNLTYDQAIALIAGNVQ